MTSQFDDKTVAQNFGDTVRQSSVVARNNAASTNSGLGEHLKPSHHINLALRACVIYGAIALLWLLAMIFGVEIFLIDEDTKSLFHLSGGVLFVAVTTVTLYAALRPIQERELNRAEQLQGAVAASRDGLWVWDIENDRILATPGGDVEVGWAAAETIRDIRSWRAIVHPDDWSTVTEKLQKLATPGNDDWQIEQRFRTSSGGWHWFQIKGYVVSRHPDGRVRRMEGSHHSIDGLKRTQASLQRANRALSLLVSSYNALATGRSRDEVFSILVKQLAMAPEYVLVWIGEAVLEPRKPIRPIVSDGPASEFLSHAEICWSDDKHGSGPSGTAIRTGKPSIITDVRDDERAQHWLPILEQFNIRSAVSIPIMLEDDSAFVLQLDCAEPDSFSADEIETYEMIGQILSISMKSFDLNFRFAQSESARLQIANRLETALHGTIAALIEVVEKRDPYTAGHQQRVAEIAVAIGAKMGVSGDRLEGIYIGACIHDIGKIGVPTEILSKPGRLDEEEIALIRRHAAIGNDIVRNIDFGWPVEKIVHQHHERWDGSGYPQGLAGEEISIEARIVAVADVVESMGTNRPYRPSIPWQRVIGEIRDGSGSRYDPDVVDAALLVLDKDAAKFGLGDSAANRK